MKKLSLLAVLFSSLAFGQGLTSIDEFTNAARFPQLSVKNGLKLLGGGLKVPTTGPAALAGTATLVAGTVTVSTTAVAAGSLILVSYNTTAGTTGAVRAPQASIVAGTSFVISSTSGTDTSTVNWFIASQ